MKSSLALVALITVGVLARPVAPSFCRADAPAAPAPAGASGEGKPPPQDLVIVDEKTEQVIRGALKYLASKQQPNGSWGGSGGEGASHPAAMTAYTLMAFLAAGNVPGEGEYGKNVSRGVGYLISCVDEKGYIHANNSGSNMYGHGIAAIALAEIYGQGRDPKLRPKLEQAIKLICDCQSPQGGWRYSPRPADADISVTVLQVVALRAAKNSGLDVPQTTIDRAVAYVKTCYDENSGGFTYQPKNRQPGFARTAAGIYCLQVCGRYEDPMVKKGSDYLLKTKVDNQWYTYGLFYAGPAQYMIGGDTWKQWYEDHSKLLMGKVKRDGDYCSWDPLDGKVGNVYATAVYTTILAMPYHYIPLYQR